MNKKTKNDKVKNMNKVKKFIQEKNLISHGEHIIVGVSGGADSVCVLLILHSLQRELDLKITAVHINHMIRTEAVDDEKFVKDLCGKLSIPCISFKIDVKMIAQREKKTLEEAGRKARYDIFYKTMKKYHADKIAVAHHQNDQAETFLYRCARGTGIYGAGAMKEKDGALIRPLLCIKKQEIVKYLQQEGQEWVEDASNQDDTFARNQIRNQIIPRLEGVNEQAVEHIGLLCEDIQEVTSYLAHQIDEAFSRCVDVEEEGFKICCEKLQQENLWIQKQVFKKALEEAGIEVKDSYIAQGDFSFEAGYQGMKKLYEENSKLPTAVVTGSDVIAVGAIQYLDNMRVKIPDDISIMGFDDSEFATYIKPELSTVRISYYDEGVKAAEMLRELMDGSTEAPMKEYVPHKIIRRSTTKSLN